MNLNKDLELRTVLDWFFDSVESLRLNYPNMEMPSIAATSNKLQEQAYLDGKGLVYDSEDREIEDISLRTDFLYTFKNGRLFVAVWDDVHQIYLKQHIYNREMYEDFDVRVFDALEKEITAIHEGGEYV